MFDSTNTLLSRLPLIQSSPSLLQNTCSLSFSKRLEPTSTVGCRKENASALCAGIHRMCTVSVKSILNKKGN